MSKLKYGTVSAIGVIAGLSLSQALAGELKGQTSWSPLMGISQESWNTEHAKSEYEIQKQECDVQKYSQPEAYEPCLQKARSTRDSLLTQGSEQAGQGSQGSASNQSQQFSGQEKGPIDKMTSAVKEKLADWGIGSSNQGREGQPNAGQGGQQPQGQSTGQQQGGGTQGSNPLQQGFEARHMQGQDVAPQNVVAGDGQGGQNFGQQGLTQGQQGQQGQSGQGQGSFQGGNYGQQPQGQSGQQGAGGTNQQFQGQQGQSDQSQGSFQGGNYGQQPQGQSGQQGAGGTNQQFQSGGTQGLQGSSSQQGESTGGWVGEKQGAHMDRSEYYQILARQQYVTLKQECNTLKQDPDVYEQCQKHAESIREKILGMAEEGADATQRSNQRGG